MSKSIFPRRDQSQPETQFVRVTPDLARQWLGRNLQNRAISKARVEKYARDMRAGRWYLTHQGIAFDVSNNLRDGQHRLTAIVIADVAVEMMVTTGLPDDVQAHIDTGRARTPADMLSVLDGTKNASVVGAVAKMAVGWDRGFRWFSNYQPTHDEIRDYVNAPEHHHLHRAAEVASHGRKYVPVRPSLLGLGFYISARVDYPDTEVFYVEQLIEQLGLASDSPAKTLHRRLVGDSEKQGVGADFNKLAYMITAWNKFRDGEKITKLQAPKGPGWTQDNYPDPK